MNFLKIIGTLFILLNCGNGFSFSNPILPEEQGTTTSVSAELEEGVYYFSDSTLASPTGFTNFRLADFLAPDFYYSSSNESRQADTYIRYSSFIVPSLDINNIIFPFHFFL